LGLGIYFCAFLCLGESFKGQVGIVVVSAYLEQYQDLTLYTSPVIYFVFFLNYLLVNSEHYTQLE